MGSKLILLLGLILGAALAFVCVMDNKEELLSKYQHLIKGDSKPKIVVEQTEVISPEPILPSIPEPVKTVEEQMPELEPVIILNEPIFSYTVGENTKLSAKLSPNDKNEILEKFILNYCQSDVCLQDITFDDNTKVASWQDDAFKIASFLKDKDVKNGLISVNSRLFTLKGELKNSEDLDTLNELIKPFSPTVFRVENLTKIAEKVIVEEIKEPQVNEKIEQAQENINKLLLANPIYFRSGSSIITKQSEETLNKIIDALKIIDNNITLKVEGHTDAIGGAKLNKSLSQKRADSVKSYMFKSIKDIKIEATGYGEEKPVSQNPNDKINRRVEIHLMKGVQL